jgi:hypothetical protein
MEDVGIEDPQVMHFGDLRSRNDFDGEGVGVVGGSLLPGHLLVSVQRRPAVINLAGPT